MLNPTNDRLDYGQLLAPPNGYQLDFAVGTTYSLDLDALTGACIALGLSEETDSDLMKNPICLLEALRATGDKVALFCEGGQIQLPGKVTSLYILLEKMVFQVNAVKCKDGNQYASFHPKFWLLRYVNEKHEVLYRTVILSRNLTFDRSWDVTFCMDGKKTDSVTEKNAPIQDFLAYLMNNLGKGENSRQKAKAIRNMLQELPQIKFDTGSKAFYDYEFLPTGISNHSIFNTQLFRYFEDAYQKEGLHEIFIMSPFVSNDVIKFFNERNRYINHTEYVLITRAMSLSRLKPADCNHFKIFTMKDAVLQGEMDISDGEASAPGQRQDIHAKVYMLRKGSDADLYLGSLNATHNALYGNVEFMICLHSKNRYLNMEKLTADIFGGEEGGTKNPFQQVSLPEAGLDEEKEPDLLLSNVIKNINRMNPEAIISEQGDFYTITLEFRGRHEDFGDCSISVAPLLAKKEAAWSEHICFTSMALTELSVFYRITVSDGERSVSRVIKVPTKGMPEGRERAVVSSMVDNKDNFYRYVAFLLGDSFVLSALETGVTGQSESSSRQNRAAGLPALYEKMLQTAATAPERFKEIDYLLQAVSKDGIVPEEFEELYHTFQKAVKHTWKA